MAHTVLDIKVKKFLKTLGDVEAMKLFYTLADTVDKAERGKLQRTVANSLAKKLNTWRNTGQCLDLRTLLGLTRKLEYGSAQCIRNWANWRTKH